MEKGFFLKQEKISIKKNNLKLKKVFSQYICSGCFPDVFCSHNPGKTEFAVKVFNCLKKIKPGTVISYGDMAGKAGSPGAFRAVGQILAGNPLPLLYPCHRVVRSDGSTGGFMGEAKDLSGWKDYLIGLEKKYG